MYAMPKMFYAAGGATFKRVDDLNFQLGRVQNCIITEPSIKSSFIVNWRVVIFVFFFETKRGPILKVLFAKKTEVDWAERVRNERQMY